MCPSCRHCQLAQSPRSGRLSSICLALQGRGAGRRFSTVRAKLAKPGQGCWPQPGTGTTADPYTSLTVHTGSGAQVRSRGSGDPGQHKPCAAATLPKSAFVPVWLLLYFFPSRGNQAAFSGFFPSFPALGGVGEDTTPAVSTPARVPWHPGVLEGCPPRQGGRARRAQGHGRQANLIPAPFPPPAPAADRAPEPRETLPTLSSPCRRLGAQVRPVTAVQGREATSQACLWGH